MIFIATGIGIHQNTWWSSDSESPVLHSACVFFAVPSCYLMWGTQHRKQWVGKWTYILPRASPCYFRNDGIVPEMRMHFFCLVFCFNILTSQLIATLQGSIEKKQVWNRQVTFQGFLGGYMLIPDESSTELESWVGSHPVICENFFLLRPPKIYRNRGFKYVFEFSSLLGEDSYFD